MLGPSLVDLLALDSNIPLNAVLFSSIYTDIAQNRDNLHNRTETTLNILSITPLVASARITTFLYLQMTVTLTKKILLISRFQN